MGCSSINSEVTALSIAGIRVPEMKKAPSHFILSAVSNSYSIIQIRSNYVKLPQTKTREQRAEKRPQNTPKNRLSVNHFGHHLTLFLPSFWPVNHLRTTKNWVKTVLVFQIWSNYISPFRYSKTPENLDFPGFLNHFDTV